MSDKSKANNYQDQAIKEVKDDIKDIRSHLGNINGELGATQNDMEWLKCEFQKMRIAIDEIKDKINSRPSWLMATAFGVLCSILVGLVVFLVTK